MVDKGMIGNLEAGCKVNLYLDIVGVRDNGYHEIESLFYPLPWPCDQIRIEEGGTGISLSCSDPALASRTNILFRAYELFTHKTGFAPSLAVFLQKNIPVGAGLGGGSSNAAAFISWLNSRAGTKALEQDQLADLALALGADVPFFLANTPAWVTGVGEYIQPVTCNLDDKIILIICPPLSVNTKWAYIQWDLAQTQNQYQRKRLTHQTSPIKSHFFTKFPVPWNCFEEIIFAKFPLLRNIKQDVLRFHADTCIMSGSGSSLVAFFSDKIQAVRCAQQLRRQGCRCFASQNGQPVLLDG